MKNTIIFLFTFLLIESYSCQKVNQIDKNVIVTDEEGINNNIDLYNLWEVNIDNVYNENKKNNNLMDISKYQILGKMIKLDNIKWHMDYVSGFELPLFYYKEMQPSKYYNTGIDVKFSREISRFNYAIRFAQNYTVSKDEKYYQKFKELILDWIDENPFYYGDNWTVAMVVGIRAVNWIVALNIFGEIFDNDNEFKNKITKSLVQHATYIEFNPEIGEGGRLTNHATGDFTGLLFLALALQYHMSSDYWLDKSVSYLEECIRYQTYEDGVNFEGSVAYHRFVLEMFAFSAIVCRANNIELSKKYYELLFKMFEYTAAYLDHGGNAPQIGDNDSGRLLKFHDSEGQDHSYLLELGEHIFNYNFKTQCTKKSSEIKKWLPEVDKIDIQELNLTPRETDKSIIFEIGGAYFLKNEFFSLMVSCSPGQGGHHHHDKGSITLSVKGMPVIVDPGAYTYTRNLRERNIFRGLHSHNVIYKSADETTQSGSDGAFGVINKFETELLEFTDKRVKVKIKNVDDNCSYIRNINIFDSKSVVIEDICEGSFVSSMNLHPDFDPVLVDKHKIRSNKNNVSIVADNNSVFYLDDYFYSSGYGVKVSAIRVLQQSQNKNTTAIEIDE
jgi:hypothetical protein